MPIPERPFQDNFWSNAGVQEARDALERGTDIHVLDADGLAPLHIVAAVNPDPAVMRLFLDQGADIMALDARGRMPLHWAAGFNSLESVGLLIDSGSEVHGLDGTGETPLHWAAANNPDPAWQTCSWTTGRNLMPRASMPHAAGDGGDLRQAGRGRGIPAGPGCGHRGGGRVGFHAPPSGGPLWSPDVVRLLLERGFDPNASHDEGSGPPLLQAAMGGDPLVVKALLEHGADVHLRDGDLGWTLCTSPCP